MNENGCSYKANEINNSSKLQMYSSIIDIFEPDTYIDVLRHKKYITSLAKFRCSNEILVIEWSHMDQILYRGEIDCKYCNVNCSLYISVRTGLQYITYINKHFGNSRV